MDYHQELMDLYKQALNKKKPRLAYRIYCFIQQSKAKLQRLYLPEIKPIKNMTKSDLTKLARYLGLIQP